MRCRIFMVSGAVALMFAGTSWAGDADPALAALEKLRTDKERELSELVAPSPKEPESWPAGIEVFLVEGYISYNCVRIFRKDGKPVVQRVKMTRSWFYSPKESYTAEQWGVTEDQLREVWNLAERIRTMGLKVQPRPLEAGGDSSFQRSFQSSSHEHSVLVRIQNPAGDARFLNAERGKSWSNGVQDLKAIQTRALYNVFEELIPKDHPGEAFPLAEWEPFLVGLLASYLPDLPDKPRSARDRLLLVEVSLQLLGQAGGLGALEVVRAAARVKDFRDESARAAL
ncbi:MAG TPA: hypothetical protein VFG14_08185, partial [Chthoniobacteraceae bacterium]|nr:hypothetical protein [Chthoniobacteraceae bacterium]